MFILSSASGTTPGGRDAAIMSTSSPRTVFMLLDIRVSSDRDRIPSKLYAVSIDMTPDSKSPGCLTPSDTFMRVAETNCPRKVSATSLAMSIPNKFGI